MPLNCGIVGLPNVGKSTIFSALTSAPAEAANYAFCTIEPNVGIVDVPDERLAKIAAIIPPQKLIPATMEFVDIAGLVKGASKGEGRGNAFLADIREVNMIAQVVRCFDDDEIVHVHGRIDPLDDMEVINLELILADLQSAEKRLDKAKKMARAASDKDTRALVPVLEKLVSHLGEGLPARSLELGDEEKRLLKAFPLITGKKLLYICNVHEDDLGKANPLVDKVRTQAEKEGADVVEICGKLEAEIAALETQEEKDMFLEESGITESGLARMIRESYKVLGMRTYFTAGEKEVRAWTFHDGDKAPQAAAVIHTDFEKGFIKAEVYHCEDLFELGSESAIKQAGKLRIEGKDYVVQDGDVMHFRFNV
jgi:GTP-binding protein YchF